MKKSWQKWSAVLGFTRNETGVLLFLVCTLVIGIGIWTYRQFWEPLPIIVENGSDQRVSLDKRGSDSNEFELEGTNSDQMFSINAATQEQLERLPGVGPVIAARIIEYRDLKKRFQSIDELLEIRGIGPKTVEAIKPYLSL